MNKTDFKQAYGKDLHLFLQTPLGRSLLSTLREEGPQNDTLAYTPQQIIEFGSVIAAQQQGWGACVKTMTHELALRPDEETQPLGEADYSEQPSPFVRQPQPQTPKSKRRK